MGVVTTNLAGPDLGVQTSLQKNRQYSLIMGMEYGRGRKIRAGGWMLVVVVFININIGHYYIIYNYIYCCILLLFYFIIFIIIYFFFVI